jgi:cytochrome c oxidase accessory protein FixG
MPSSILEPEEHVLSTLEKDGSRRWLKPKLSHGKLLTRRRWMAWALIAIFTLLPFLKVNGKPFVLLNIPAREFTIAGFTFLPTDTVLLAIFMVGLLLTIVLFTALFGRVWCGWACPQTVYMEFLFRPIERLFDGTVGRGGHKKQVAAWRIVAKYVVYLLICFYLANTFLAYFVGVETLSQWIRQSPLQHPVPFLIMAFVTAAMMFDFCFFREQLCLVACPYGRFQSVLLDQNSLIVAYDTNRGEPRGKLSKKKAGGATLPVAGDCIDCGNCVTTCPTGIDIRDGLQMECINCTQCIDACNLVMKKIGRPLNLIRYSSQARDAGKVSRLLRARTIIYPLLLAGIATAFVTVFLSGKTFDAVVLREAGNPYTMTGDDRVRNLLKLKLTNRSEQPMSFAVEVLEPAGAEISFREESLQLPGRGVDENGNPNLASRTFHASVVSPQEAFQLGRSRFRMKVKNEQGVERILNFQLIGPYD